MPTQGATTTNLQKKNGDASDNDGITVLDFADQGDVGKALKRPSQFKDSDVHLPIKGSSLTLRTRNF